MTRIFHKHTMKLANWQWHFYFSFKLLTLELMPKQSIWTTWLKHTMFAGEQTVTCWEIHKNMDGCYWSCVLRLRQQCVFSSPDFVIICACNFHFWTIIFTWLDLCGFLLYYSVFYFVFHPIINDLLAKINIFLHYQDYFISINSTELLSLTCLLGQQRPSNYFSDPVRLVAGTVFYYLFTTNYFTRALLFEDFVNSFQRNGQKLSLQYWAYLSEHLQTAGEKCFCNHLQTGYMA